MYPSGIPNITMLRLSALSTIIMIATRVEADAVRKAWSARHLLPVLSNAGEYFRLMNGYIRTVAIAVSEAYIQYLVTYIQTVVLADMNCLYVL